MSEEKLMIQAVEQLNRIAVALENLVINQKASMINQALQQKNKGSTEIMEEVLMDLTEVTVIAITEKAMLVTKKGYQKWLPNSTIEHYIKQDSNFTEVIEGDFLDDIELTAKGKKWIPDKSWEPFKVVKK